MIYAIFLSSGRGHDLGYILELRGIGLLGFGGGCS